MPLRVRSIDDGTVRRLVADLRVRATTAACLAGRGVREASAARAYLEPRLGGLRRPEGLAGFADAVERIARAITAGERIGVFGDYDVDGVTTAALLGTFLADVGCDPMTRVARRDAGYGFGDADAAAFAAGGCRLVVTGDCGTSDIAAIAGARSGGIDVVVVDHHTVPAPGEGEAHPAVALVNPFRHDSTFPFRGLASVGLAFYLVAAVRTRLDELGWFGRSSGPRNGPGGPRPDVRELLDLVALGTIADLVPLQGENRILARHGLGSLGHRPGIAALLRAAGVEPGAPIDEKTVAWKLAPRLNAPGRLGDADPALRLLLASAADAERCAAVLEAANQERRAIQDRVLEDALGTLDRHDPGPAIVVAGRGWSAGVVGIVAAKLVDLYRRPAVVIAVDEHGVGRGSARSFGGVDLYRALGACSLLLDRWGGHAAAAGLTIDETRVVALRESFGAAVASQTVSTRESEADAEVRLPDVDERLCEELAALAPFGQENTAPLLVTRGVTVKQSRRVGDGSHLKLEVEAAGEVRGAIGFGLGEQDPGVGARIDLAFSPTVSTWQGRRRVELEVRALVPCQASASEPAWIR